MDALSHVVMRTLLHRRSRHRVVVHRSVAFNELKSVNTKTLRATSERALNAKMHKQTNNTARMGRGGMGYVRVGGWVEDRVNAVRVSIVMCFAGDMLPRVV